MRAFGHDERMRRIVVTIACLAVSLTASGFAGQPSATPPVPVVVELFTSEGCSSCPPADALLELWLQEQPIKGVQVIALSEHVTYWDHQGWKDPFGAQQFTARQQEYGRRFNLESIYTPQLVVDGSREFVGSDKRAIERALADAAKVPKPPMQIAVSVSEGSLHITASGPGLSTERNAELVFAVTEDRLMVDVQRGENARRTLKHSGVVRWLSSAGEIGSLPKTATVKIAPDWRRDHLRVVAFVQSRSNRRIISAAYATP
jgi:hypothetical protein